MLISLFLGCANINDEEVQLGNGISIFRSGRNASYLMSERKIKFDSDKYVIQRFGKLDSTLVLETIDSACINTRRCQSSNMIYFIINMKNLEVRGGFSQRTYDTLMDSMGLRIYITSPYDNLDKAGIK